MSQETLNPKMGQIIARCWADAAFKTRLLAEPAATLKALGIDVPAGVQLRVLADSEPVRHLVIPCPPAGLSDVQLEAIAGGQSVNGQMVDAVVRANVGRLGDLFLRAPDQLSWTSFPWHR